MAIQWKGVFPALTTKFTADDQLDLPLFEKNLEEQLAAGIKVEMEHTDNPEEAKKIALVHLKEIPDYLC